MNDQKPTLISAIRVKQEQLTKMVSNQRERLRNLDVYKKSCELDQLIVQYMRMQTYHRRVIRGED